MNAISIKNIQKSFGSHKVLNDISVNVAKGSLYGLIGLNGIGKTTLIKIALNLIDADSGDIKLFDIPVSQMESRKQIAFLPEKFQPSPFLKGNEFLELTLSYYKKPYKKKAAEKLLKQLDFDISKLDKKITHYSKGMTQKIGLVSALLIEAPLLILDEPMSGLDPRARIALKEVLTDYCKKGHTIFFSSHILSDIDEICDRIAILHDCNIVYQGAPAAFKSKYKNKTLEQAFLATITTKAPAKKAASSSKKKTKSA